jgi:hypothetical protein
MRVGAALDAVTPEGAAGMVAVLVANVLPVTRDQPELTVVVIAFTR